MKNKTEKFPLMINIFRIYTNIILLINPFIPFFSNFFLRKEFGASMTNKESSSSALAKEQVLHDKNKHIIAVGIINWDIKKIINRFNNNHARIACRLASRLLYAFIINLFISCRNSIII